MFESNIRQLFETADKNFLKVCSNADEHCLRIVCFAAIVRFY